MSKVITENYTLADPSGYAYFESFHSDNRPEEVKELLATYDAESGDWPEENKWSFIHSCGAAITIVEFGDQKYITLSGKSEFVEDTKKSLEGKVGELKKIKLVFA